MEYMAVIVRQRSQCLYRAHVDRDWKSVVFIECSQSVTKYAHILSQCLKNQDSRGF